MYIFDFERKVEKSESTDLRLFKIPTDLYIIISKKFLQILLKKIDLLNLLNLRKEVDQFTFIS